MDYIIAKSIASSAYESGGLFHYIKFKIEMKKQKHQIKRDEQYSRVKSEVERYRCETYDDEQFIRMAVNAGGLKKLLERVRLGSSSVSKYLETERVSISLETNRVFEEDILGKKCQYDAV